VHGTTPHVSVKLAEPLTAASVERPTPFLLPQRGSAPWQTRHVIEAPSEIDGGRVLKIADLAHATPSELALPQYDGDSGVCLFYCDENWSCLNDTRHEHLAAAKAQAESEFEGVTFRDP
jgi:hypothetical protein